MWIYNSEKGEDVDFEVAPVVTFDWDLRQM